MAKGVYTRMKSILNTVVVIIIILCLLYVGYQGYLAYEKWQQNEKSHDQLLIESLKANEGTIAKLSTKLSEIEMKVINDTLKTTVEVIPDKNYESLKEQVIELKEDEEANKDEIEALRTELSIQRKAFLASDDTILIKTIDDQKLLLYRDEEGTLQPASANIESIIEHRELSAVVPILAEEKILNDKTRWDIKAGGYYSFNGTYGVIVSKEIYNLWDYSINASLLLSDFEDVKFAVGGSVGYLIGDNLEIGVGYSTDKSYYVKLQYQF